MSETITLLYGNNLAPEDQEVRFDSISESFLKSEYVENLKGGWPFIRCLSAHLVYDRNLSWSDPEKLELLYENVWPLVRDQVDW